MSKQDNKSLKGAGVKNLVLYHFQSCPFCAITREAISGLEKGNSSTHVTLNIEQKDILKHTVYRKELIEGGGKPQVPCLKIETDNGTIHWLYESRDIINFLQQNFTRLSEQVPFTVSA